MTDNAEEFKEDGLWKNVIVEDDKYGHKFYHSDKIPVSHVKIVRTREDLPLDK